MKNLKIGFFADGPWSHIAFEFIKKDGTVDVQFIVARKFTDDKKLEYIANKYSIPFLQGYDINSEEFINLIKPYQCDLFVSMSFDQIFKKTILAIPPLGVINCHASHLPFYRGRNVLNWVLINDEDHIGITVHYIDEGIDTGDIILQETFPITDLDNYKTLLELAYQECARLLYKSLTLISGGTVNRIKQSSIHPIGFYCAKRKVGDEIINWNQNSRTIFNFIRAICNPGPMATTFLKNKIIRINSSKLLNEAPNFIGIPGQIVGINGDSYIVKTADSIIEICDVSTDVKLKIGDRLG